MVPHSWAHCLLPINPTAGQITVCRTCGSEWRADEHRGWAPTGRYPTEAPPSSAALGVAIVDTPGVGEHWRCAHCGRGWPLTTPADPIAEHAADHNTPWWLRLLASWWTLLVLSLVMAEVWIADVLVLTHAHLRPRWGWIIFAWAALLWLWANVPEAIRRIRRRT